MPVLAALAELRQDDIVDDAIIEISPAMPTPP